MAVQALLPLIAGAARAAAPRVVKQVGLNAVKSAVSGGSTPAPALPQPAYGNHNLQPMQFAPPPEMTTGPH